MNDLTPEQLEELRKAYEMAVLADKKIFVFMGSPILTDYAGYLLDHARLQDKGME
jgi:hypothetical protein